MFERTEGGGYIVPIENMLYQRAKLSRLTPGRRKLNGTRGGAISRESVEVFPEFKRLPTPLQTRRRLRKLRRVLNHTCV